MARIEFLKEVLQTSEMELKQLCKEKLLEAEYKVYDGDGFLYAPGEIPILLVAHLDTVHLLKPSEIYFDRMQSVLWSPQGIGGDDRCGVFMILKLIKKYKPYVLFTEQEERGAIGAEKAVEILKQPDVKFIIELDRRGNNDCVFYECGNKEFQEYIEKFGFKTAIGSFSDISVLCDEWDIASVNLSSGYYKEHTNQEIINVNDMKNTYDRVIKILEDDKNNKTYFDHQTITYTKCYQTTGLSKNGDENYYEDDDGYYLNGEWHWWKKENSEKYKLD